MGSSPVTATIPPMSFDPVEQTIERFFGRLVEPRCPGARTVVLVAFSGGPDSTALLAGLARTAPRLDLDVHAAHLDHGLDADSARRAREAGRMAAALAVPFTAERLEARDLGGDDGPEAVARRARYAFLDRRADEIGARFVATAHHADDQAETVLLRLAFGSGVEGLRGIRRRHGRLVRPLLALRRRTILESLERAGLEGLADPTNEDLAVARNRVRRLLLPRLERRMPGLVERLSSLAAAADGAAERIDGLLEARLSPRPVPREPGVEVERAAFEALPRALQPHALALLHRRAGASYPAGAEARRELLRQLTTNRGGRAGCDCGEGWRWEVASGLLQVVRRESSAPRFAYTVSAPGAVEIPELSLRFRLRRGRLAPWMFTACPRRAGLAGLGPAAHRGAGRIVVRNRRPGDRVRPLGGGTRRLKELLIDRRVPRRQRDRLPLLVVDGEIAWVPGVAVGERFRLNAGSTGRDERAWIAEIEDLEAAGTKTAAKAPAGE